MTRDDSEHRTTEEEITKLTGRGRGTTPTVLPVLDRLKSRHTGKEKTMRSQPTKDGRSRDRHGTWCGNGTVLVVEDDDSVSNMAVRMLQRFGMDTLVARDGHEGLDCFRQHCHKIDLVLLDLTMPGMDGAELLGKLRDIRAEVPVLLTSGFGEDEVLAHLGTQRPDGILRKPYRLPALRQQVQAMLDPAPGGPHGSVIDS